MGRATTKPFQKKKRLRKKVSQQGWEVVERYISELKEYEKTDTVPVVVVEEEKKKCTKQGT